MAVPDLPPEGAAQAAPFLRAAGGEASVPDGWVSEPAGDWNGEAVEVVYDPRLYDVRVLPSERVDDREQALVANGWSYRGTDGHRSMWVRDRAAMARRRLEPSGHPPAGRDLDGVDP
jgi:hypothetical protein